MDKEIYPILAGAAPPEITLQDAQQAAWDKGYADAPTPNKPERPSLLAQQEYKLQQLLDEVERIRRNIHFLKNYPQAHFLTRELRALGIIHF